MESKTILLADDEDPVRGVLRPLLEHAGYQVAESRNGHETVEMVREINPDLILLDLNMPGMDGYTVLLTLKSHLIRHNIPVVVLSGEFVGVEYQKHSRAFGAIYHLEKPVGHKELLAVIEKAFLQQEEGTGNDE